MKTTFRTFLEAEGDVASTKRQTITHLEAMRPVEFLEFAQDLLKHTGGELRDLPISLKVDGFGARLGKDKDGAFFFETSRSGPIQKAGSFSAFTQAKGGSEESISRAKLYDNLYDYLEKSHIWRILPDNTKVVVEILFNPMGRLENDDITFVSVKYDRHKLGTLLTIVPIGVTVASSGEKHPEEKELLHKLLKTSTKECLVISPDLEPANINLTAILDPVSALNDDVKAVLLSRKAADKPLKETYTKLLQDIKDEIAQVFLQHLVGGKDKLGPEVEGYVVEIKGKLFKITTSAFKAAKAADKLARRTS